MGNTLAEDGRVMRVLPLTTGEGKELRRFLPMRVPEHGSRSGTGILPFFLCDNAAYLLGLDSKRGEEKRAGARALHEDVLASCDDAGAQAVRAFFERDDCLEGLDETLRAELAGGGFMSSDFRATDSAFTSARLFEMLGRLLRSSQRRRRGRPVRYYRRADFDGAPFSPSNRCARRPIGGSVARVL